MGPTELIHCSRDYITGKVKNHVLQKIFKDVINAKEEINK